MKILLINHYAGSPQHGMEYRPYYLAREWMRLGQEVTIVAASRSHVRGRNPKFSGLSWMESIDGIRYCWFWTPNYSDNGPWRALNILVFLVQLILHRRMLAKFAETGSVIASSTYPFDVVVARSIAKAARADLTYEVHDLWPLSPIELGKMSAKHPFIRLVQWAENFAYRNADLVISILPLAEQYMRQHGLTQGKFRYIPNGIDVDEWVKGADLPDAHRIALSELRKENRFLIGYAGSHGIANSLDTVLQAADRLTQHPITFVLVGQGPEKQRLEQLASDLHLKNVVFLPPVPKSAIPTLLAQMDCHLIALRPTWIFTLGISPNKLMDYMMSGRPIVQAIDAGNDMVAESGCGMSVPAGTPAALARAVLEMAAKNILEREEMGRKGREYVQNHHDFRVLAPQFLRYISTRSVLQQNLVGLSPLESSEEYHPSQSV